MPASSGPICISLSRAHDRTDVYRQYQAGADDIVREMFDSSLRAGRYVLENMGLSEYEADEAQRMFYDHDRMSVRELAELWRPDVRHPQKQGIRRPRQGTCKKTWRRPFLTAATTTKRSGPDVLGG